VSPLGPAAYEISTSSNKLNIYIYSSFLKKHAILCIQVENIISIRIDKYRESGGNKNKYLEDQYPEKVLRGLLLPMRAIMETSIIIHESIVKVHIVKQSPNRDIVHHQRWNCHMLMRYLEQKQQTAYLVGNNILSSGQNYENICLLF
jgi:hypothetical protein